MTNKIIKKTILLIALLILLIGVVSAADNTTTKDTNTLLKQDVTTTNTNTLINNNEQKTTSETKEITKHNTTTNTKTSTAKTRTKITINKIKTVEFSDKTKITGTYKTSTGKPLKNTILTLNINNIKYTAKTNNNGVYTYNYKTNKVRTNKVTATYPGNSKYTSTTTKTTFKVTKKGTHVKLNYIPTTEYTDNVIITGKFTDNKAKALMSATIILKINGKQYTTKTDNNGEFTYNYKIKQVGTNNITAYFRGNDFYKYNSTKKTFKVNKMNSYTSQYQPSYDKTNKIINIGGIVYDDQSNYLKKALVTININGKYYQTKTDNDGYFSYQAKPTNTGINTITTTYPGNNNFIKSSDKKTINIPKIKSTKITMDIISKTSLGDYAYITGQFTDNNYNPLKNSNIVLRINGKNYNTRTDDYGYYYYSYKTTKIGTNKVTATFKGNSNYKASTTTKTFAVTQYKTIELYTHLLTGPYPEDSERVGDDIFQAWYQLTDRQHDKGVHLSVYDYYANDMGDPPYNLIVDATFYFKNNAGNIITKKFEKGTGDYMYHSLVSGYTPYKVVAEYRKMTSAEKNKWYYGYGYNPKTKKWFSYY